MISERIPLSHEIQAYVYRNVLRIIKEKGCGYDEAWDILKKELNERINSQMNQMKEDDKNHHKQHHHKPKVDRNRNEHQRIRRSDQAQRTVCEEGVPAESGES